MMGVASAACGNCNAGLIENGQQLADFPFVTAEAEAEVAGQALVG